ncbi:MAG TPA: MCE family protein, partial [Mycobacterium sp.]|nr:MCE family protein [Mycobacterium sp.]
MTSPRGKINKAPFQPFRVAGVVVFLIAALVLWLVFLQYSGDFTDKTKLTMLSDRAGLVMDPGSKVTYNGVQIGRVDKVDEIERDGKPAVKFSLDVYPKYLHLIPANVDARIVATTVFGEKYVSMTAPENPLPQRITPSNVIDARSVTTEINTLFQTITSIAEKVDPVKVNLTLSAAAQALSGLGDRFGQSIINGSAALDEVNPRMPIIRHDIQQLATLSDTYAGAAPDLVNFLNNAATTAHTIHAQEKDLDRALLAAAGFGATGAEIFNRGGPYLARGAKDLVPTAQLLDTYSPELFCSIRNLHDGEPKVAAFTSPYSLRSETELFSGLGLAL